MRVRNIPWAKDYLPTQSCFIENPNELKGKWKEILHTQELHVEIGTGKGDYWIQMSEMYPTIGWIGIEKNTSISALALKKVENDNKDNRLFINLDAKEIENWFDEKEIDVIHLNFSDPWPKKRNMKRRLSHSSFLNAYKKLLSKDGKIIMKTDNTKLFEYSIIEFQNNGFILEEIALDYRKEEHLEDAITEYESKFMKKGQPIYRGIWHQ
ncbi:MAG: tRNA (guanosine(46)-N7)-methyltransferase TrmB [Traorella sp.]